MTHDLNLFIHFGNNDTHKNGYIFLLMRKRAGAKHTLKQQSLEAAAV